jgi:DNA (cytosine-5)-methyltransferase 1
LFCGAGGAAMGLHRAWPKAEIIGVDIKPQPRYPFEFVQVDAMTFPLDGYDFIWASPPCQAHSALKTAWNARNHEDLIPAIRENLRLSRTAYCIENVPGAPLLSPVLLCGSMFNLRTQNRDGYLRRHRLFEASFPIAQPGLCNHSLGRAVTVVSKGGGYNVRAGRPSFGMAAARIVMEIDWMDSYGLSQAVPPAYSEWIARQYMEQL